MLFENLRKKHEEARLRRLFAIAALIRDEELRSEEEAQSKKEAIAAVLRHREEETALRHQAEYFRQELHEVRNPNTSAAELEELAQSRNHNIRILVIRNTNTSSEVRNSLVSDSSDVVRMTLATSPYSSYEALATLTQDSNAAVSAAATLTLQRASITEKEEEYARFFLEASYVDALITAIMPTFAWTIRELDNQPNTQIATNIWNLDISENGSFTVRFSLTKDELDSLTASLKFLQVGETVFASVVTPLETRGDYIYVDFRFIEVSHELAETYRESEREAKSRF